MLTEVREVVLTHILSGPPATISPEIIALCEEIAPGQMPRFIELQPDPDALPRECFRNVLSRIEERGGELVFGWAIWEWPGVFVEAEHHGVWGHEGKLTDVTPHEYPADRVLFLPDPSAPYDFENATRRNNWKRPFADVPQIRRWIASTDRMHEKLESCSVGREYRLSAQDQLELRAIAEEIKAAKVGVYLHLANQTGPNGPCVCRSDRKFKKCCAPLYR